MRLQVKKLVYGVLGCVAVMLLLNVMYSGPSVDSKHSRNGEAPWGQDFHDVNQHVHGDGALFGKEQEVAAPMGDVVGEVTNPPAIPPKINVWPDPDDVQDRIVEQLSDTFSHDITKVKKVLVYNGDKNTPRGNSYFKENDCAIQNCVVTTDHKDLDTADAVLFRGSAYPNKKVKKPGQVWVMSTLESPLHTRGLAAYKDVINWTATYRRDSTIVSPYEKFVFFKNFTKLPELPSRNYAEGKNEKVAWFVSNCNAGNGRLKYVKELAKHISVHIYGPCGDYKCPRSKARDCFDMLNKKYKFYLAFENSNCRDYITEKFYWNGLWNDVLPVVMGAAPEDYEAVAPPHSYIHVDDFDGPAALATFLHKVDQNDTMYNEYFKWKGTGEFINTKFLCRMCRMMHEADYHKMSYSSLDDWWRGKGVCVSPYQHPWSTWRGADNRHDQFSKAKHEVKHHDDLSV